MLTGLNFGNIKLKTITIDAINLNSYILKIRFVTLKGECMHFTCNENRTLLSILLFE